MATRSFIFFAEKEPTLDLNVKGIYCHYDGYLEGVGNRLKRDYDSDKKVRKLIALGGIRSLARTINKTKREVIGDIGDKNATLTCSLNMFLNHFKSFGYSDIEYIYLRIGGKWFYSSRCYSGDFDKFIELKDDFMKQIMADYRERIKRYEMKMGRVS